MSKRTSSSAPKISGPQLTVDEQRGLRDYWEIYQAHREQLTSALMRMVADHPEFASILQLESRQQEKSFELQRRAVFEGDWDPYLEILKTQGSKYAQMGHGLQAWFEM